MVGDYGRRFIVSINEQHDATPRDQIDRRGRGGFDFAEPTGWRRIKHDADPRDEVGAVALNGPRAIEVNRPYPFGDVGITITRRAFSAKLRRHSEKVSSL